MKQYQTLWSILSDWEGKIPRRNPVNRHVKRMDDNANISIQRLFAQSLFDPFVIHCSPVDGEFFEEGKFLWKFYALE